MLKILLATTSSHKIIEFKNLVSLSQQPITLLSLKQFKNCQDEAPETHDNFADNALQKANYYWNKYHLPVLCDDSGLEVFKLNHFPGVNSKRWLEKKGFNFKINELLKMLKNKDNSCQYVCALAYRDQNHQKVFIGTFAGKLVKPQNNHGFGFDSGFFVEKYETTLENIQLETKNRISHRAIAFSQFTKWSEQNL